MNADGENLSNLANHRGIDREPQWSPDGTMNAFISYRDGNQDVCVMDADGSNVRIVPHAITHRYGRLIAFPTQLNGKREIFVVDVHTQELQELSNVTGNEFNVVWKAD